MPLIIGETEKLVSFLHTILVNAKNQINPVTQIFSYISRFEAFSHYSNKVIVASGPLRNKHLVNLVVIATRLFQILLPAKMHIIEIKETFWEIKVFWYELIICLRTGFCVIPIKFKRNRNSQISFLVTVNVACLCVRFYSRKQHRRILTRRESHSHLEIFVTIL